MNRQQIEHVFIPSSTLVAQKYRAVPGKPGHDRSRYLGIQSIFTNDYHILKCNLSVRAVDPHYGCPAPWMS